MNHSSLNSFTAVLILFASTFFSQAYAETDLNPKETTNPSSEIIMENNSYLTTDELTSLFSGSTMTGVFENKPFGQRNHANGIALLAIKGDEIRFIPWFTEADGVYCEDWGRDGVLRFKLRRTDKADHYVIAASDGENTLEIVKGFTQENFD